MQSSTIYQVKDALQSNLVEVLTDYRMPDIPVFLYYHPAGIYIVAWISDSVIQDDNISE